LYFAFVSLFFYLYTHCVCSYFIVFHFMLFDFAAFALLGSILFICVSRFVRKLFLGFTYFLKCCNRSNKALE